MLNLWGVEKCNPNTRQYMWSSLEWSSYDSRIDSCNEPGNVFDFEKNRIKESFLQWEQKIREPLPEEDAPFHEKKKNSKSWLVCLKDPGVERS